MEKEKIKQSDKDIKKVKDKESNILEQKQSKEEEIKELTPEEKIKNLDEKIVRVYAEMENQRRRFEKEKEDAFEYGGSVFAREALHLIDNLERSKQSIENDENLKNTDAFKKIIEHLDIIYKDTISIFKKNNIEPIKSIGEKLDPNLHQAMMEIEDDSKDIGTIVQEIQKGFKMKDRLLRPSLVGVSKKTSNTEVKSKTEEEKDVKKQEKAKEN